MIGRTLSHYKILEELNRGGMGIVYRALDVKLDREVALKVLPPELVADPDRKRRFIQEAKATAKLNHPHIGMVFEIDEADGVTFIAMELIRGEQLKGIIDRGKLPLARSLELATEVAEGLAVAHEKGIVHRDLKPANIMVTEQFHPKIIDFGLAKLLEPLAGEGSDVETAIREETASGTVLGTVSYMSPEQARGRKVDHRSDIFSFGIMLFEMLTGRLPFDGPSGVEVLNAIIKEPAPRLTDTDTKSGKTSFDLQRIVHRCLAKDPADRHQTVNDLLLELRRVKRESESGASTAISFPIAPILSRFYETGRRLKFIVLSLLAVAVVLFAYDKWWISRPPQQSIVVLPFENMSDDASNEYFSDGISEELLNLLARIPELRVISRTSAFSYKGKQIDIPTIASQLNVANVLEGSVRRADNQVRITVQLIDARSDTQLWSEIYDRKLDDIFATQDEIAAKVLEQLQLTLLGHAPKVPATTAEAYTLVLQARYLGRQRTPDALEKSIALLEEALAIDPDYAATWGGLARAYARQSDIGLRPTAEGYTLAREAANQALALDPTYAPAHNTLGWIARSYDRDLAAAARHNGQAFALEPANADGISSAANLAWTLGRLDQAIALAEYGVARDPVNPMDHANLGIYYLSAGRLDEAIASFRTTLTLSPDFVGSQYLIGMALLLKDEPESALTAMQKEAFESLRLIGLAMAHHALGQTDASDAALAELIEKHEEEWALNIAYVLAFRGEADRAFEWLHKAVGYNDPGLAEILPQPAFANVHADPRWLPFLESIGMSPEKLAAIEFEVPLPE